MPFSFNADLLAYYQQNVPTSAQTQPIGSITYPPITDLMGPIVGTPLSDMNIGALDSPFSTLPISGITTITSPATIGTFIPPQFATGTPGTMTYNSDYTDPNIPPSVADVGGTPNTGYWNPNGSLLALGSGVAVPPNNLSPLSSKSIIEKDDIFKSVDGVSPWRSAKVYTMLDDIVKRVPTTVNFFDSANVVQTGFTTQRSTLAPSEYKGIDGTPGAMTFTSPLELLKIADDNHWNDSSMYAKDQARLGKIKTFKDEIDANSRSNIRGSARGPFTLEGMYKSFPTYDSIDAAGGAKKPLIIRGIQRKDKPEPQKYGDKLGVAILDSALEVAERSIMMQLPQNSNFLLRRGFNKLFSLQSSFAIGSPPWQILRNTVYLQIPNPFAIASALNFPNSATISRIPFSMSDYSNNELMMKYGLGSGGSLGVKLQSEIYELMNALDNGLFEQASDDLVPFFFVWKDDKQKDNYLQFRGTIKTLSHSTTPQWSSKKYFGRPDSVHTYNSFDQNLSFAFDVYAETRATLKPMYQRLEHLHDMTKPYWDEHRSMMTGPVVQLTIGDYIVDQPGFLKSLSIQPNEQVYWDIGEDPMKPLPQIAQMVKAGIKDKATLKKGKKVPRAFSISIQYQFIEKSIPDRGADVKFWDAKSWD